MPTLPPSLLLPLEKSCTLKDDEVLLILAQELGQPAFSSLVHTPTALLPTLTNLAGTEETVVREAAVTSLLTYVGKGGGREEGRNGKCVSFSCRRSVALTRFSFFLPFSPFFLPSLFPSLLFLLLAASSPPSRPPCPRASPPSCRWHKAKCSVTRSRPPRSFLPSTSNSASRREQGRGRGREGRSS